LTINAFWDAFINRFVNKYILAETCPWLLYNYSDRI